MSTANLGLCKELYKLSGWDYSSVLSAPAWFAPNTVENKSDEWCVLRYFGPQDRSGELRVPAYSFDYLWRKLPPSIKVELSKRVYYDDDDHWSVDLTVWYGDSFYWTEDFSSVEDALASLLIRMIKDKNVDDIALYKVGELV